MAEFEAGLAAARELVALAVRRDRATSSATCIQALFRGCSHRLAFRSRLYAYLACHDAKQLPLADALLRRHAQSRQVAGAVTAPILIFAQLRREAAAAGCEATAAAAAKAATATMPSLAPTARVAVELSIAQRLRHIPAVALSLIHI